MQSEEGVVRPSDVSIDDGFAVLPVRIKDAGESGGIENLLGEALANGTFRLVYTPGLTPGFAAEDVVRYVAEKEDIELVERGMKVGVQFFHPALDERVISHIEAQVAAVGGSIDGHLKNLLVLTFPVTVRVKNIQSFLQEYENRFGVEWFFVNLFTEEGEPLGWWKDYV
ncbi:DUF4265 domain-containing protein [Micromonospora trifolii]|uniref:DUF4265 domain-containing protein n=1 Tax=Micromonospora trifolii TaxID=2911208 RepID=UPI003CEB5DB3